MAEAQAQAAPPAQEGSFFMNAAQSIGRAALMYYGMQWLKGNFNKDPSKLGPNKAAVQLTNEEGAPIPVAEIPKPANYLPLWQEKLVPLDLHVYLDPEEDFHSFEDLSKLVWKQQNLKYGNLSDVRVEEITLDLTHDIQRNGSLYAHMYVTYKGHSPDPESNTYIDDKTLYYKKLLTRYQKKQKVVVKKNLVKKKAQEDEVIEVAPEIDDGKWVSYWWQNLTICLVGDVVMIPSGVPQPILEHVDLAPDGLHYYPIFYTDDFWLLSEQLQPINETLKSVNLTLKWEPKSWWYFQLLTTMEDSLNQQMSMMGSDRKETDEMKRMFSDTNPILLGVTMFVSLLHSLFDFLAFKNDISFWKDKKNTEGMSFRTIVMNVVFQLIIFLYLLDNETSWMIIISNGIGLVIEAWKINKTVIVKPKSAFPYVEFIDRFKPSKLARKTRKYDEMAFQYLSYVLYPLLAGYTIYSAVYEEHKGWYSFVVGTLVGFVYMFGFINMTPQLFINYKLKSVAHMPWKTFMYKALNTFIDDLFAFVIKMPWLHRIACLRDDLIFFVYLYQRWVYPEDKRRRNEFGQVGDENGANDDDFLSDDDEDEEDEKEKKEKKDDVKEENEDGVKSRKGFKNGEDEETEEKGDEQKGEEKTEKTSAKKEGKKTK
ncbi:UNVERIFIED_CONTAM: Cleft lip and palate transmembrane protein 1 like protein [Siphonaria sp. JEL0065]|nr:Cleft lip and palate transmembrane protein 1 like protein [Siphonaria sp. JEL0065]